MESVTPTSDLAKAPVTAITYWTYTPEDLDVNYGDRLAMETIAPNGTSPGRYVDAQGAYAAARAHGIVALQGPEGTWRPGHGNNTMDPQAMEITAFTEACVVGSPWRQHDYERTPVDLANPPDTFYVEIVWRYTHVNYRRVPSSIEHVTIDGKDYQRTVDYPPIENGRDERKVTKRLTVTKCSLAIYGIDAVPEVKPYAPAAQEQP
jgi:hypothetical protein